MQADDCGAKKPANLVLDSGDVVEEARCFEFSEVKMQIMMCLPVVLTYLLQVGLGLVNISAVGHLGVDELAGATLGMLFANVSGISVMIGVVSAVDTLASQAFGMKQYSRVGIIAQRACLITLVLSGLVLLLWWNVYPLLVFCGQPPSVALQASIFLRCLSLGLFPLTIYEISKKYLQVQGIMRPTSCVMALAVPFNMAMTYLFIFHLDLGFIGSPLALVASWTFMMTSSLLYIRFAHVLFPVHCPQDPFACWGGWSRKAFKKWAAFLKIGLPAAGQICIEWWAIELVVFEAGLFGVVDLAASNIIIQLQTVIAMIPLGMAVASSVRVGQALGSGEVRRAQNSGYTTIVLSIGVSMCLGVVVIAVRHLWPLAFTRDGPVCAMAAELLLITGVNVCFDSLQIAMGGVLRGAGLQVYGAAINFICQWLVGIPLGALAGFYYGRGAMGLWWGQMCGTVLQVALEGVVLRRIDWDKMVQQARSRAISVHSQESRPLALITPRGDEDEDEDEDEDPDGPLLEGGPPDGKGLGGGAR